MSSSIANTWLDAMQAAIAAALPTRIVQRDLIDPAQVPAADLEKGVVCLLSQGGGQFANYLGREGELGRMRVAAVGYLLLAEDTNPAAIERAELQLLQELLDWTGNTGVPGLTALPQEFRQSQQLEHPYGWLMLGLEVWI